MTAYPGDIFFTFENIITGCAIVGVCGIYVPREINTGAPQLGDVLTRGVITTGRASGVLDC